jgi:hypothetical protein
MESWLERVKRERGTMIELLVKPTQRVHSPEVTVAPHQVSQNRPGLEKLELDSREQVTRSARAAWRSDQLAQAFFAPVQPSSIPWRD